MEKSVDALTEHEVFVRELVALYKQTPVLWQQKHPDYRNKRERAKAYVALVKKAQQYYPEADEDFVRMKIESMRASFRKERKKVLLSKQSATNPEDIHKPSLWYYELFLFLEGGEAEEAHRGEIKREGAQRDGSKVKIPFWSREHTAILINFYKNYPCLWYTSHPSYKNKRRRKEAVKRITDKLIATTGKSFDGADVRKKISLIRGQFLFEYKKVKNCESQGVDYNPTLWCYEMLSFLKKEYVNTQKVNVKRLERQMNMRNITSRSSSTSEESEENVEVKKESDAYLSSESVHFELNQEAEPEGVHFESNQEAEPEGVHVESNQGAEEDIFDTIARNLAHQFREMTGRQRDIANRIVRDVMYHGQMEHLTDNSRLTIDGM